MTSQLTKQLPTAQQGRPPDRHAPNRYRHGKGPMMDCGTTQLPLAPGGHN